MHLGRVLPRLTQDIYDLAPRVLSSYVPVEDPHDDLISAGCPEALIIRDKDILAQLFIIRHKEGVATGFLQGTNIDGLPSLENLDDTCGLNLPLPCAAEGKTYPIAMQCMRTRTIRERNRIKLRILWDEGGATCTAIKTPFEGISLRATTGESSRLQLL